MANLRVHKFNFLLNKSTYLLALVAVFVTLATFIPLQAFSETNSLYLGLKQEIVLKIDERVRNLIVSDPSVISVELLEVDSDQVIVSGLQIGESLLVGTTETGEQVLKNKVVVRYPVKKIQKMLDSRFPGNKVRMFSSNGTLMLQGSVTTESDIKNIEESVRPFLYGGKIINQIITDIPKKVRLYVRLVELNSKAENAFGIDWKGVFTSGAEDKYTLISGDPLTVSDSSKSSGGLGNVLFKTGLFGGILDLNFAVDLLAKRSYASILTEPNISTLSGEKAEFRVGRQIPIPTASVNNDSGSSISSGVSYQFFGLSLQFTPKVLSRDKISLKLRVYSNDTMSTSASVNGNSLPVSSSQNFETAFELRDSESFAVAGLFQKISGEDIEKVPGIADIPILGDMFKRKTTNTNQSELIILVTPYLIQEEDYIKTMGQSLRSLSNLEYVILTKSGKLKEFSNGEMPRLNGYAGFSY